jgi:hypothetical protein
MHNDSNIGNIITDLFDNISNIFSKPPDITHKDDEFVWFKLYDTNLAIQEASINTGYEFIWFNLPI